MSAQRCEICFQDLMASDTISICTSCGEDFHHSCIMTALKENAACPICKESFMSQENPLFIPAGSVSPDEERKLMVRIEPVARIVAYVALLGIIIGLL